MFLDLNQRVSLRLECKHPEPTRHGLDPQKTVPQNLWCSFADLSSDPARQTGLAEPILK